MDSRILPIKGGLENGKSRAQQDGIQGTPDAIDDGCRVAVEEIITHIEIRDRVIDEDESGSPGLRETKNSTESPKSHPNSKIKGVSHSKEDYSPKVRRSWPAAIVTNCLPSLKYVTGAA